MQTQIQHLQHHQVNKQKWDDCINQSPYGLIYATTLYLDNMCEGWTAITGEDYSWVMPLTHNRKLFVSYLYQPAFSQQLGAFAKSETVDIPWKEIVDFLKTKYRFWEISFNYNTPPAMLPAGIEVKEATNFILPLGKDYSSIREGYHKDLQRNLKRSHQFELVYKPAEHELCIDEYAKHYSGRMKHVTQTDYAHFRKICDLLAIDNKVICRKAMNRQNELLATVLLLFDGKRLYNMMNTTTSAGRKVEANHFLINSIIREFAGREIIFDFEGSDLPGVKSFYENFGAANQPYFMARNNNLPWPLRLFK